MAIDAIVEDLNKAFVDFKASHNARLAAVSAEVERLQSGLDDTNTKIAAREMNGPGNVPEAAAAPTHAAAGLRGAAIRAHYGARAQAAGDANHDAPGIAEFMRGVAGMRTTDRAMASLAGGTDSAGGYALPHLVMPSILDAMAERSALLQAGASIVPIEDGAKTLTTAAIDTVPKPSWRKELGNVAEADPTFRGVVMKPRSLAFIIRISRELLMDAPDMDRALRAVIAQAYAAELDRVGLVGSGVDPEPLGIAGTAGVNTLAQAGAALGYRDILEGYRAILEQHGPPPTAAIMAPRTLIDLSGKEDTTGQPLNRPPLLEPVQMLATTGVPTDLGSGDNESLLFLGDFRVVQFGMRELLSIALLREAYSKTGEIGFLCHARADVAVSYPAALATITGVK